MNLQLVDLSAEAVRARNAPGEPLLRGWGDLDVAREIGERSGIAWLREKSLGEDFAPMFAVGERTRARLGA